MTGNGAAAAVAALSAALGADPGRGDLWSELATALVAAGRAREAWDAAARAVELAPGSPSSHHAIGTVAAALGDSRQAESAYRHALHLDPTDQETRTALARLPSPPPAVPVPAVPVPAVPAPAVRPAAGVPGPRAVGSRHAAPDDGAPPTGRHSSGRRRAPEPVAGPVVQVAAGGRRRAPEGGGVGAVTPAVGIPAWLAPSGSRPDPLTHPGSGGWPGTPVPVGATRAVDADRWRRELIRLVRVEWLVGIACVVGLAYARTAPYTAGLLAGVVVVAVAYGRMRWQALGAPPASQRTTGYAAVLTVVLGIVVVPAAMVGALTLARLAAVAAVTCATFAAAWLGRDGG